MLLDSSILISVKTGIYPTWQKASSALRKLRVSGLEDYKRKWKQDSRLPEKPHEVYADFPGWPIFINRTNRIVYTTLEEVREAAIKLGINSRNTYGKKYKKDPLLPSDPRIYTDFKGWIALFEKVTKYPTCAEAQVAARRLTLDPNLTPYYAYGKAFSRDPRLPKRPHKHYEDFLGYAAFLGVSPVRRGPKAGKGIPYPTWQEAGAAARARKMDSEIAYLRLSRYDRRLPKDPETHYKDFPGWEAFLAKPAPYPTWREASDALAGLDIYSREEYLLYHPIDPRLPEDPETEYEDFPGWLLFLW